MGFLCVAIDVLELTLSTKLALAQRSLPPLGQKKS